MAFNYPKPRYCVVCLTEISVNSESKFCSIKCKIKHYTFWQAFNRQANRVADDPIWQAKDLGLVSIYYQHEDNRRFVKQIEVLF